MMEKIIEYDIDVSGIAGLSDRLPYALNRIAEEKLSRQDILTFFPIVWNKFEAYVKKIMYIADLEGFNSIVLDPNKTLPNYLDRLHVPHQLNKAYNREYTWAFKKAKDLRKSEAHDCENWSVTECYEALSQSLLSYLLITEHCLDILKAAILQGNLHSGIPLYTGHRFSITKPGYVDLFGLIQKNPGVNFCGLKSYSRDKDYIAFFDLDGTLEKRIINYNGSDYNSQTVDSFVWKTENGRDCSQIVFSKIEEAFRKPIGEWEKVNEETQKLTCICTLNEDGEVIRYTFFKRNRKTNSDDAESEYDISYLSNGGCEFLKSRYREETHIVDGERKLIRMKKPIERIRFNNEGLIISVDKPYKDTFITEEEYKYDEIGHLFQINHNIYRYTTVETIGNEVFSWAHDEHTGEERLEKKQVFKEGKLIRTYHYSHDTDNITEESFEYY